MTDYSNSPELKNSVLGKSTEYVDTYTPSLLFPIARKLNRDALGVSEDNLPFKGQDIWTGYELSWLNSTPGISSAASQFKMPQHLFLCRIAETRGR